MITFRGARRIISHAARDPRGTWLALRVHQKRLTYLQFPALFDLRDRAREAEAANRPGAFVEAGCALGGSAIVLAKSKSESRELLVYDVFAMIPPPSSNDGLDVLERYAEITAGKSKGVANDAYYGYQENLLETVRSNFQQFGAEVDDANVELIEGLFEETMTFDQPIALAHIDADWYESVATCLERIWPVLAPGGVIVIDDYDDWSGCRRAVDEFLAANPDAKVERRYRLHVRKD